MDRSVTSNIWRFWGHHRQLHDGSNYGLASGLELEQFNDWRGLIVLIRDGKTPGLARNWLPAMPSSVSCRIDFAVPIASRALETSCAARARLTSSADFASSNSACARMIPSWLFRRWKSSRRSESMVGPLAGRLTPARPVRTGDRNHAWDPADASFERTPAGASWPDDRHSVSAKVRGWIAGGRTYSTFAGRNPVVDRAAAPAPPPRTLS